jgi:hypothetical protein
MAEVQIAKVSHRHEAIIDWLMANPHEKNLQKLCDEINVSRSWLSVVMNSDAFLERMAQRRAKVNDELAAKITTKTLTVANKALDRLNETLTEEDLNPNFVAKTTLGILELLRPAKQAVTSTRELTRETTRMVDRGVLVTARETLRISSEGTPLALPGPEA